MEKISDKAWKEYVSGNDSSNIFHSPEWENLLKKEYGFNVERMCEVDKNGKIVSGIQFCEIKDRLVALPFSDHYSIVKNANSTTEIEETMNQCSRNNYSTEKERLIYRKRQEIDCYSPEQINNNKTDTNEDKCFIFDDIADIVKYKEIVIKSYVSDNNFVKHQEAVVHFGYYDRDFEKASESFTDMHKKGVKKAKKEGLYVIIDKSIDGIKKFYDLHLITRKKQGVPVQPYSFFVNLYNEVINKGLGFVALVKKNDIVLSGGIFLHFNKSFTYKFGASDSKYLNLRPNNLLFYEMIKYSVENDYRVFDFGKTDLGNEGLRKFKSGWGAVEIPLFYSYYPNYNTNKLFEFVKSNIVTPLVKYSPVFVCKGIGKIFYKYMG